MFYRTLELKFAKIVTVNVAKSNAHSFVIPTCVIKQSTTHNVMNFVLNVVPAKIPTRRPQI